jgi:hypothetical protein
LFIFLFSTISFSSYNPSFNKVRNVFTRLAF